MPAAYCETRCFVLRKRDMNEKKIGRPRIDPDQDEALDNYTVRMSFRQARIAKKIGGGVFSEGLRLALDRAAADMEFMNSVVLKNNSKNDNS
jgi:hypothetical protein